MTFLLFYIHFQIYDANTNSWKIVDKHSHTDFVEKIVEHPRETILIDDITDITNIRNERLFDETRTDISNIKDINNITNITNKKTYNQTDDTDSLNKSTIVYDSINIDRKVFKDTTSVIDEKVGFFNGLSDLESRHTLLCMYYIDAKQ